MLDLVITSYKLFLNNFKTIFKYAVPYLLFCCIGIYINQTTETSSFRLPINYAFVLLIPLISAATDVAIYRHLLGFGIVSPLSCIKSYIKYTFAQILIGLVGTAPLFFLVYILRIFSVDIYANIVISAIINLFIGMAIMARFNIILPLIIQNKTISLKDFLSFTNKKYIQWVVVASLIYMPYIILHYITDNCPYTNMLLCNTFMYIFICFNVSYVNQTPVSTTPILVEQPQTNVIKKKVEIKTKPATTKEKKSEKPKTQTKKATSAKKTTKVAKPRLKPVTV